MVADIRLNNGRTIPQVGLGLWKVTDPTEFDTMFDAAIAAGYRHFDSAQIYHNEHLLGAAIARHGLNRNDIFITTKIHVANFITTKKLQASFAESLKKLQTDHVDLLLLHFPVTALRGKAWQALVQIQEAGGATSIGVSNFTIRHLQQLVEQSDMMPAVNQVELHVFLQQPELLEYCHQQGIAVEAYSPLAHARANDEPVVQTLAEKHGVSYAQIMLRWCIQKNLIILPKSRTPTRLAENVAIFDFELSDDDMAQLAGLDRDLRTCWSPVHVP